MWSRPSAATTSGPVDEARAGADERLVEGLRRGAPDAFADLHERYAPGIYNLALRMVRRGEDAEDITQDVLIRAFERVPREREVMLRPWLYRLTVNRCYDHLRAAKRRGVTGHRDEQGLIAQGDPFEKAAQGRLLEAALRGLTKRQRAALLLKDVHGLTTLEVASALELTPGSVEVLLARSRNAFRASYVRLCRAEDMPAPSTAGAVLGLGLLPRLPLPASLKTALQTSLKTPTALAPGDPGLLPAIDLAAGSLGAALSTSTVAKVAAALLAAATIAGAGPAGPRRGNERPPRDRQVAAVTARTPAHGPSASLSEPTGPAVVSPPPVPDRSTASATPAALSPDPSPAGSASPSPEPSSTPLGAQLITPSPTSSPTATSAPTPTSTPSATSTPSTTPSATPSPSPSTD